MRGLATTSYVIRTELIEQDCEAGYAHFKTYVRDVMGNKATDVRVRVGQEDFGDYAEKASTKVAVDARCLPWVMAQPSLLRWSEGDRIVDRPVERRRTPARTSVSPVAAPTTPVASVPAPTAQSGAAAKGADEPVASEQQMVSIRKLCGALGKPEPASSLSYAEARQLISQLSTEYQRSRRAS